MEELTEQQLYIIAKAMAITQLSNQAWGDKQTLNRRTLLHTLNAFCEVILEIVPKHQHSELSQTVDDIVGKGEVYR